MNNDPTPAAGSTGSGQKLSDTAISSDNVRETHIPGVDVIQRKSFFHADSRNRHVQSKVYNGSVSGSAVNVPPPPKHGSKSIVHVDNIRISNRYKDDTTVESIHRKILNENPRAFHRVASFGEEYIKAGIKYRHITPVYSSHQRLTSLEDALKNMTIAQYADSRGSTYPYSRPHTSSVAAEIIAARTGRLTPSLVPHNVPRFSLSRGSTTKFPPKPFDGDPLAAEHATTRGYTTQPELSTIDPLQATNLHSRGIASRGSMGTATSRRTSTPASTATRRSHSHFGKTAPYAMEQHAKYTSRSLQWKPAGLDPEFAKHYAEAAAEAVEDTIPEPLPLLQVQATPFEYLSRTSSSGATQRNYVSGLSQSLRVAAQNRQSGTIHVPMEGDVMTNSQFLGYSTLSKPLFMDSGTLDHPIPLRTASQGSTRPLKMGTIRRGDSSRYSAKIQPLAATNRLQDISPTHSGDHPDNDHGAYDRHNQDHMSTEHYREQEYPDDHHQDHYHEHHQGYQNTHEYHDGHHRDLNTTDQGSQLSSPASVHSHSAHNTSIHGTSSYGPQSSPSRPSTGNTPVAGGPVSHTPQSPSSSHPQDYSSWDAQSHGSAQTFGTGYGVGPMGDQLPHRVSRSAGGFRSLARMDTGREVITKGLLQARAIRRMESNHNVDLGMGYIEKGLWPVLNLRGDTRNSNTRTLKPQPEVGKSVPVQNEVPYEEYPQYYSQDTDAHIDAHGDVGPGAYMLQKPEDVAKGVYATYSDHALNTSSGSLGQFSNENIMHGGWAEQANLTGDGISKDSTALGNVLMERTENVDNLEYETLKQMTSMVPNVRGNQSTTNPELKELDKFERVNDLNNPSHWTKKSIRSKIIASGLMKELGFTPETLAKASKEMLLAAYQRIPSVRRMLRLYSGDIPPSTSLSTTALSY